MDATVSFLTGTSPFSAENQAFWMAVQGAMAVAKGPNKDKKLHWFHAFTLSVLTGFAGGLFGSMWMGKPAGILSNDMNMASCIVAFLLVNCTPYNIGYKLLDTLPLALITVSFAQIFRANGIVKFVSVCFQEFKTNPSPYYPIPVFGPILYATLLGNMGGFFMKGVEGHVGSGTPWPVQNGVFCATFYHFFVNDQTGPIGGQLRRAIPKAVRLGLDESTFAAVLISFFMQVMGLLQMPRFLGSSFSPFDTVRSSLLWKVSSSTQVSSSKQESVSSNRKQAIQKMKAKRKES